MNTNTSKRVTSFDMKQAIDSGNIDRVMNYATSGFNIRRDIVSDVPGWDALHYAVFKQNLPIVIYLIVRGADPNGMDGEGLTPLHLAARTERQDIIKHLLAHGADVNAESVHHWTPLHEACLAGNTENVLTLIEHGADANVRNADNQLPVDLASQNGHTDLVTIMREIASSSNPYTKRTNNNGASKKAPQARTQARQSHRSIPNTNTRTPRVATQTLPTPLRTQQQTSSRNSNKLIHKLPRAGPHFKVTASTEFIGEDVMPVNDAPPSNAEQNYFFDTKDVRCEIVRAFNGAILDHMQNQRRTPRNPYTNRQWPLDDTTALRSTLKRLPNGQTQVQNAKPSPPPPRPQTKPNVSKSYMPSPQSFSKPAASEHFISYNKKRYKLRTGDKGGQYILVHGKRVYLKSGFEAIKT